MSDLVHEFEKRFAKMLGSEYAIAVNSGTSALHASLEAINVRHNEVIMPALCPAMVAFAVIQAGGWPVFADVDPETQLVTHETIRTVIGSRTKAIIAVALHGLPTDMDRILGLARAHDIAVVEDCCQCLLGRYKDSFAGTKATIGCYSFERKKHLTTGSEGGMILTNSQVYAERARKFAGLGYRHLNAAGGGTRVPEKHPAYKRFDTIGLNYRMSEAQAEIGIHKLRKVQDAVWLRQEIGYLWTQALGTSLQPHDYDADNVFYSAAWDSPFFEFKWKELHDKFVKSGGDGFYAMPQIPYNEPALEEYKGLNPVPAADRLQQKLILLKTHYYLKEAKRQAAIFADCLEKV